MRLDQLDFRAAWKDSVIIDDFLFRLAVVKCEDECARERLPAIRSVTNIPGCYAAAWVHVKYSLLEEKGHRTPLHIFDFLHDRAEETPICGAICQR